MKLEKITGIGKTTAENLKEAGIDTVQKLAESKLDELLKIKGIGKSTAQKYISEANALIKDKGKEQKVTEKEPKEQKQLKKEEIRQEKPKEKITSSEFGKLITQQAECNIGLVGHVDHGTSWKFLPFP